MEKDVLYKDVMYSLFTAQHVVGKGNAIAVREIISPLREITCHIVGSHSVTCHPAAVTFPPLTQPKLVLDLATPEPEGCKAELS